MFVSFNMQSVIMSVSQNATSINDKISKIYYPAGIYAKLINSFNVLDLIVFILINIMIFVLTIFILYRCTDSLARKKLGLA